MMGVCPKCGGQLLPDNETGIKCLQCSFVPGTLRIEQPSQNLARDHSGMRDNRKHREYNSYDKKVMSQQSQGRFKTAQARGIRNVS